MSANRDLEIITVAVCDKNDKQPMALVQECDMSLYRWAQTEAMKQT